MPNHDAAAAGIGPRTAELFAVFRRHRDPASDAVPAPAEGAPSGAFGIDRSESRRLPANGTISRAWALPAANDYSCIAYLPPGANGPGFGCNDSGGDPNVVYVELAPDSYELFGLVRDGYSAASVKFADGASKELKVSSNVFSVHAVAAPTSVTLSGPIGTTEVKLGH